MAMPIDGCCNYCHSPLSPEGWCVLKMTFVDVVTYFNTCGLTCALQLSRHKNVSGRRIAGCAAPSRVITVNQMTYNPLEFLTVSPYELFPD